MYSEATKGEPGTGLWTAQQRRETRIRGTIYICPSLHKTGSKTTQAVQNTLKLLTVSAGYCHTAGFFEGVVEDEAMGVVKRQ